MKLKEAEQKLMELHALALEQTPPDLSIAIGCLQLMPKENPNILTLISQDVETGKIVIDLGNSVLSQVVKPTDQIELIGYTLAPTPVTSSIWSVADLN